MFCKLYIKYLQASTAALIMLLCTYSYIYKTSADGLKSSVVLRHDGLLVLWFYQFNRTYDSTDICIFTWTWSFLKSSRRIPNMFSVY